MRSVIFPMFLLGAAIPAFADLTYICDPNIDLKVAGTCAYLNSTIAGLYNSTFANVNASIYIQYGNTDLGQSFYILTQVSYSSYLNALAASAQASGNAFQVAAVKALNSFDTAAYGNSTVEIPSALGAALGFRPLFGISADGMNLCYPVATATCFNGIVTITNEPGLYYRNGTEGPDQYDFYSTAEHETDEVLGISSCIEAGPPSLTDGCGDNILAAVDLFRYQSAENLILISTTPGAYFSYNGGQTNGAGTKMKVYNTLDNGEDYADFVSSSPCSMAQSIQDAEGCPGQDAGLDITNDGGAEINILNAVGYSLNPQAVTPPVISSVLNGATLQPTTIAANTYVTIKGTGLSTTNPGRQWAGSDFTTNSNGTLNLPTSLDGTSVTVNGTAAYVEYISPVQVNIITPAIAATGNGIQVIVDLNGQLSAAVPITLQNLAPAFFAYYPGTANDGKYLVAQHAANLTMDVGPVGLYPGAAPYFTTPAVPGETIVLYGTGFGPTSPPLTPGIVTDKTYNLSSTPTATLGGIPATVGFAGLIASFADVYQFNVVIPASAPNGDLALIVNVNGTESFSGLITVHAPQ